MKILEVVFENEVESLEVAIKIGIPMAEILIFKMVIILMIIIEVILVILEEIDKIKNDSISDNRKIQSFSNSSIRNRVGALSFFFYDN